MVNVAPVVAQLGLCGPILSNRPLWLLRWFCSEGRREKCLGVQMEAGSERASVKALGCNWSVLRGGLDLKVVPVAFSDTSSDRIFLI